MILTNHINHPVSETLSLPLLRSYLKLVKLRLHDEFEVNKVMELASMPKLEYLWVPGLSTEEENFFKFRFPHLKINDGFLTSIARPDQSFKRQHGLWEKKCSQLDFFSPKY